MLSLVSRAPHFHAARSGYAPAGHVHHRRRDREFLIILRVTDSAPSLAGEHSLHTAIRNAAGKLHSPGLTAPDTLWTKDERSAGGAPWARPHPGSPQPGRDTSERFAGFTPCSAPAEGGFAKGKASLATVEWVVFPQMGENVLFLSLSVRWSLGCFLDSRENNSCLSLITEE